MTTGTRHEDATLVEMALFPEMNPGPVFRADLDGRIVLVNSAAAALFGAAGVVGRAWPDVCVDLDRAAWARALAGDDMQQHESTIGERVFTFTYRRPPNVPSIFIYGNDITERKRDERLLAEQQAKIAEMARFPDMNPGPVLRVDRDAYIILANMAARELLGEVAQPGRCWRDICPAFDEATWQRILATTEVVPVETTIHGRNYVFAHRRGAQGDQVFVYGSDVTQLRATQEALRQSERMATLGTLAAGVAHELNNPAAAAARGAGHLRQAFATLQDAVIELAQLRLTTERGAKLLLLLREDRERVGRAAMIDPLTRSDTESVVEEWIEAHGIDDPSELAAALVSLGYDTVTLGQIADEWGEGFPVIARWIGRAQPVFALSREIEEATRRISEIVKALKSYSFLGQAPVRGVDVTEGLESTLVMLRAKLRNVHVQREYADALPPIQAQGSELNQVWTNLIDNAIQALDGSGKLTVRTCRDGAFVAVEIEDDGPGIAESIQSKVFDPFFTTKEPGKGTGLGLSTTRNIVEKTHGGTIELQSQPGRTRFIVRLPISTAPVSPPP